jgi:hypothetical protein
MKKFEFQGTGPTKRPASGTGASLVICLAVVLAWFSPWWLGGLKLAPLDLAGGMMQPWREHGETGFAKNHYVSDAVDVILPYRLFAAESYKNEGRVGWSGLTFGGTAQYADTMALYDDWTMQLHRWFDFWTAWHLGLLGQVFLAASGMVLFLRGRGANVLWSSAGGLIYAANSQFATWIYHRFTLGAFCWIPWILWAIDSNRHGKRWAWMAVPIIIAMAFLGGTLQHAAMVALVVAARWGEEAWRTWQEHRFKPGWRLAQAGLFGQYAVWGIIGAGLSAFMLLPCTDALITTMSLGLHTGLFDKSNNSIYPEGSLQPLCNLASYPLQVFPSLLGRCNSVDILKLFKSQLFFVAYIGSIPTLVAFLSLFRRSTGKLAWLLILIGLLLPLTPAVRYLYQRLLVIFLLGGTIAFVGFMTHSTNDCRRKLCRYVSWTAALIAAVWLVSSVVLARSGDGFLAAIRERIVAAGQGSSFGGYPEWLEARAIHFTGDLFIWSPQQAIPLLLLAMALWGLGWTTSRIPLRRQVGPILLATAAVMEVTLFASRWVVWADTAKHPLFPETPEVAALRKHVGNEGRITTLIHPTAHLFRTPFVPNTLIPYGISTVSGYGSIIPEGMILPNESPADADRLGRLGVTHLITWAGNEDVPDPWRKIWSSPAMDLHANPLACPRYGGFGDVDERDGFFNRTSDRIIPLIEPGGFENRRTIESPSGIGWIRVAENHAPGWLYRLHQDDRWRNVVRAPDSSMLLENPNPESSVRIEMRYEPPLRKIGWIISAVSVLGLLASHWLACRGRGGVHMLHARSPDRDVPAF